MTTFFNTYKNVHFIGVGGIGISAIARMFLLEGKKVSGSDRDASHITHELEKLGAVFNTGHAAENIPADTDLVIYTIAVPADNPELVEAKKRGLKTMTYPEALGQISKEKYTIAISGAHGKTTTTAMIAKVLVDAQLDPTVVVGSFLKDFKSNFIAGTGKYLVAEACEYRRSFLNLSPKILIITNIDDDHLDYYKDIEDIKSAFREMVAKVPEDGFIICDLEQAHISDVVKDAVGTVIDYEVFANMNLELQQPGEHNLLNAAAAFTVADILDIPRAQAEVSLRNFSGTWRRFEFRGVSKTGMKIYDDYGHHPTEIKATLQGARMKFPDEKIIVVFQPHLYSRTKQHLSEFAHAFSNADEVIIAPIYPAREPFDPSISSKMIADIMNQEGKRAMAPENLDAIIELIAHIPDPEKTVLFVMGAGDIYYIIDRLL
jgi:UDP-N-acetylmuramate--alanine ligase